MKSRVRNDGLGLREVSTLELFLSGARSRQPGTAVFAVSRAPARCWWNAGAVAPTTLGTPRRAVVGWTEPAVDGAGGAGAIAGSKLSGYDVYLNVARPADPGACGRHGGSRRTGVVVVHAPLPTDRSFREISLSGASAGGANLARLRKRQTRLWPRRYCPNRRVATPGVCGLVLNSVGWIDRLSPKCRTRHSRANREQSRGAAEKMPHQRDPSRER